MRADRGGPARLRRRLQRAETLAPTPATSAPLALLRAVLHHQIERADSGVLDGAAALVCAGAGERLGAGHFPLLDLDAAVEPVAREIPMAVGGLAGHAPAGLAGAGRELTAMTAAQLAAFVAGWLDDPAVVDPRLRFWATVAAAPVLETAAATLDLPGREAWHGAACPACGGPPQVSVIAEEPGTILGGSARWLVCGRCASWWGFPRVTCHACGEDHPRQLDGFYAEGRREVRIDVCERCRSYCKTFDLRQMAAGDLVPLVDDVATLALDVIAHERGYHRTLVSLAGV